MSDGAQGSAPDSRDSDDEDWLKELLSARGSAATSASAWSDDAEPAEWLAEIVSAGRHLTPAPPAAPERLPDDAATLRAAAPASATKKRRPSPREVATPFRSYALISENTPEWYIRAIANYPDGRLPYMHTPRVMPGQLDEPAELAQHAEARAQPAKPACLAQYAQPAQPPKPAQPHKRKFDASAFPGAVLRLPGTRDILERLAADPCMEVELPPPNALAGAVVTHARAVVQRRLLPGRAVFKIGITTCPTHRWHNAKYGYRLSLDSYERMVLLLATDNGDAAAFLEAALIALFQGTDGCRNVATGGEGLRPTEGPFFTYLVISAPVAQRRPVRSAP